MHSVNYQEHSEMNLSKQQSGVTMVELMIVVIIVAIFAAIGLPSMSDMVRNNRVSSARQTLTNDLNLARGEAIKRNARVLVCSGNIAGCSNNANWSATGWVVCYDMDKNGVCDIAPADGTNPNPLVIRAALDQSISIQGPTAAVGYNPIGTQGLQGAANVAIVVGGTWKNSPPAKTISIAATGFTTVQ